VVYQYCFNDVNVDIGDICVKVLNV